MSATKWERLEADDHTKVCCGMCPHCEQSCPRSASWARTRSTGIDDWKETAWFCESCAQERGAPQ